MNDLSAMYVDFGGVKSRIRKEFKLTLMNLKHLAHSVCISSFSIVLEQLKTTEGIKLLKSN